MPQQTHGTQEKHSPVTGADSPVHLVKVVYDLAIAACVKQDSLQATKAICALREALSFEDREAAGGLFHLYQNCLEGLRAGEYRVTALMLQELREAWAENEGGPGAPAAQPDPNAPAFAYCRRGQ